MAYTRTCSTPEETKELAASLASYLRADDVVVLNGDLGAGKTQFAQGLASALDVAEAVVSPTFNIVLQYDGIMTLYHFDFYRLDDESQLEDTGYYDLLSAGGVTLIEWGEKFADALPEDYVELRFAKSAGGSRVITALAHGESAGRLLFLWANDRQSGLVKA